MSAPSRLPSDSQSEHFPDCPGAGLPTGPISCSTERRGHPLLELDCVCPLGQEVLLPDCWGGGLSGASGVLELGWTEL